MGPDGQGDCEVCCTKHFLGSTTCSTERKLTLNTFVNGDCWPRNVMLSPNADIGQHQLRLLDWEMTGLGSGPQDLGQYVISNIDPTERYGCG